MRSEVRFELLGPVRGWLGEVELELGPPQQRAVLAMLLLARGRQVPLSMLIDGLWGQAIPAAAAGTVRTYIYRLRRDLARGPASRPGHPSDLIVLVGDGYTLATESVTLDLTLFERGLNEARAARQGGDRLR